MAVGSLHFLSYQRVSATSEVSLTKFNDYPTPRLVITLIKPEIMPNSQAILYIYMEWLYCEGVQKLYDGGLKVCSMVQLLPWCCLKAALVKFRTFYI